jgi:hypothetical protein
MRILWYKSHPYITVIIGCTATILETYFISPNSVLIWEWNIFSYPSSSESSPIIIHCEPISSTIINDVGKSKAFPFGGPSRRGGVFHQQFDHNESISLIVSKIHYCYTILSRHICDSTLNLIINVVGVFEHDTTTDTTIRYRLEVLWSK